MKAKRLLISFSLLAIALSTGCATNISSISSESSEASISETSIVSSSLSSSVFSSSSSEVSSSASSATSETSGEDTLWHVNFDLNHDGAPSLPSVDVLHNGKITAPTFVFQPENDTFLGWFKDTESLLPWSFSTGVITANRTLFGGWQSILDSHIESSSETPTGDEYDYYDPDFFPVTYAVTFDANYVSGPIIIRNITENSVVRAPSLTRVGYTLSGWYTDIPTTIPYDFNTPVISPFTLYAKWEALTSYTVTLDLNYSGAPSPTTVTAYGGLKLARPSEPTRSNYDFIGWYKEQAGTNVWNFSSDVVNGDLTLYARWSRLPLPGVYVVVSELWAEDSATFTLWHGSSTVNTNGIATGVPNEYYFDHSATNYLALKRYANSQFVGQVHSIAASGGWGTTWNQIIVLPSTPKTGEFVATNGTYVTLQMRDNSIDENLVIRTVSFDLNYIGSATATTKTLLTGGKVTAPTTVPTREGYNFLGWFTASVDGSLFDFNSTINSDLTLFAQWQAKPARTPVDITYNYNFTGSPSAVVRTGYVGETLTAPTDITRAGYTLAGWYKEAGLVNAWVFASEYVATAITLYAKWTANTVPDKVGVYVLVNDNWAADNATFELEYTNSPNGRKTVVGVATTTAHEYFFEETPLNAMILMRKVNGVQVAKIYNIATWVQSGSDYRNFNTTWNRVKINTSLAGNVTNEPATNAVTYDLRSASVPAAKIVLTKKEKMVYDI